MIIASCGTSERSASSSQEVVLEAAAAAPVTTPPTPTTAAVFTVRTTVPTSTVAPSTTTTEPPPATTTTTTVVAPPAAVVAPPAADPDFTTTAAAFDRIAAENAGASLAVARGGELVFTRASGSTVAGDAATSNTPTVVASVSKIMTSLAVARLAERGVIALGDPVPWSELGLSPDAGWSDVTVRELLDHTSGMPVARSRWFEGGVSCRDFLPTLLVAPPTSERGRWRYSNGNYCALGLLLEATTGSTAVDAINVEVFEPLGLAGAHAIDQGLRPDDMVHENGTGRLSRLGAAGVFAVSSDDLALAFSRLSSRDLDVLRRPAVFVDQYGFGHTGTIDGAKSCTWILQGGATVMSASIAGGSVSTGGGVCDRLLPALATDLGIPADRPDRWP